MEINERIKSRRESLGKDPVDLASRCEMSIHEYDDLEDYADEAISVVPLKKMACICRELSIDIQELYFGVVKDAPIVTAESLRNCRTAKGMTTSDLSDEIGIYDWSIAELEADIRNVGKWVFEDVVAIAKCLGLPVESLISTHVLGDAP